MAYYWSSTGWRMTKNGRTFFECRRIDLSSHAHAPVSTPYKTLTGKTITINVGDIHTTSTIKVTLQQPRIQAFPQTNKK